MDHELCIIYEIITTLPTRDHSFADSVVSGIPEDLGWFTGQKRRYGPTGRRVTVGGPRQESRVRGTHRISTYR